VDYAVREQALILLFSESTMKSNEIEGGIIPNPLITCSVQRDN
jgi:hypothetical protein